MPWTYELADLFSELRAPIKNVCFSPDGSLLATADVRRTVRVFERDRIVFERRYRSSWDRLRALDHVRGLVFDANGRDLYVASGNRAVRIDLETGRDETIGSRKPILCFIITCPQSIATSSSGDVAIGYDDGHVEVLTHNGTRLQIKSGWNDNDVAAMMGFLPSGLLAACNRYAVSVWDTASGAKVARLGSEKVFAMAVSPSQNEIALRTLEAVQIWNVDSGEKVMEAPAAHGLPTLQFSRDGMLVAVGDREGFSLIDRTGRQVERTESESPVLSLAVSPADGRIAAGTAHGAILFATPEWSGAGC